MGAFADTADTTIATDTADTAGAPRARIIYNSLYQEGMFSSVRAGVSALDGDTDGFFILPSDCCALSPDTLAMLIERFKNDGGESVIRPVTCDRRGYPLRHKLTSWILRLRAE